MGATTNDAYHRRTRYMSLLLAGVSCGCASAAYTHEGHGNLWVVAATGAALSLPYQLLLMSPPSAVMAPAPTEGEFQLSTGVPALGRPAGAASPPLPKVSFAGNDALETDASEGGLPHTDTEAHAVQHGQRRPRRSRLMYARSGVLISPEAAEASWGRRYWCGAMLSCAAFASMMAILASRRDAAMTAAPF